MLDSMIVSRVHSLALDLRPDTDCFGAMVARHAAAQVMERFHDNVGAMSFLALAAGLTSPAVGMEANGLFFDPETAHFALYAVDGGMTAECEIMPLGMIVNSARAWQAMSDDERAILVDSIQAHSVNIDAFAQVMIDAGRDHAATCDTQDCQGHVVFAMFESMASIMEGSAA